MNLYERVHRGDSSEHFLGAIVLKTVEERVGEMTRRVLIADEASANRRATAAYDTTFNLCVIEG